MFKLPSGTRRIIFKSLYSILEIMIYESHYWKKDLLKYAKTFSKKLNQVKWSESACSKLEKDIMISAFMIRKLFESDKIDKRINNKKISVVTFKNNGSKINKLNNIFPEKYFNLENGLNHKIEIKNICNQIIHSYIFNIIINENNLVEEFWFASDYEKNNQLIKISIAKYIEILNLIGNYWPSSMQYIYIDKLNDYKVLYDHHK